MSATDGSDRILPVTRGTAVAIVPFLVVAAILLFGFPDRSGELFAWAIAPPLSAWVLASAYLGGVWFFARVATVERWHLVRHGFPAIVVFAGALLVATLLHLDRFSQNVSFVAWITLYATTPFLIAALAIAQRRSDPGTPDEHDVAIPRATRIALAAVGAAALALGVGLWVGTASATAWWAWELTPLTARVTGSVLSLTGVVNHGMLRDSRWSAFRILFQAQLVSLAAIAVSLIAGREHLLWERPLTPLFVALVGGALVAYGGITAWCEVRLRREG